MAAPMIKLGPPKITSIHDYRQFFHALLTVMATATFVGYLWYEGVIQTTVFSAIKLHYSIAFAVLLVLGCILCLTITWKISKGLNAVKRSGGMASKEIESLFGMQVVGNDTELLKEIVRDKLGKFIDILQYIANLAVIVGIVGTIDGLMQSFLILASATNPEDAMKKLPQMAQSLALFGTSMIGIVVYVAVKHMHRIARSGAYELKHRIFRLLHHKEGHE